MEKDEIMEMLDNEIEALINKLGELEPGSNEHESVTKDLERLYRLRIDETKVLGEIETQREKTEVDRISNINKVNADIANNEERIDEEKRQHRIDTIARIGETGGKALLAILLGIMGYMFEEHGTLRSPTFRNIRDTFKPKL